MKPYIVNTLNSILLIVIGSWAYFSSETPSVTALIPVIAGILLLMITPGFKKGNRVIAHIAVIITLIILIGLVKPLTGALGREDQLAVFRVVLMMASSVFAMIVFVKSFIDARRKD